MARPASKKPTSTARKPAVRKPAPARKAVAAVKPAPPPSPPPPSPPKVVVKAPSRRKGNPAGLTEKELAALKEELEQQRLTLEREFSDLEQGSFNISQSELSGEVSFDEEYADAGTFTFERERDLSLGNNMRDLMEKVDLALRKMRGGTYGACERCGRPIDKARLKALPYSVLCFTCKQQEERFR